MEEKFYTRKFDEEKDEKSAFLHFAYTLNLKPMLARQLSQNKEAMDMLMDYVNGDSELSKTQIVDYLKNELYGVGDVKANNIFDMFIEYPFQQVSDMITEQIDNAINRLGVESNEIKWLMKKPSKFKKAPVEVIKKNVTDASGLKIWDVFKAQKIPFDVAYKGYWILSDDSDEDKNSVSQIYRAYSDLLKLEMSDNQPFLNVQGTQFNKEKLDALNIIKETAMGWVRTETLESLQYLYKTLPKLIKKQSNKDGYISDLGFDIEEVRQDLTNTGLYPDQIEAGVNIIKNKATFLTGLAGSGKSTALFNVLREISKSEEKTKIFMTALSGKAVKNFNNIMKEQSNKSGHRVDFKSSTIAGIRFVPVLKDMFKKSNILIIDEISMVGTNDLAFLLKNSHMKRIVFVGDIAQLPAISLDFYSKVYNDGVINQVTLTEPKRQTSDSGIFLDSLAIRNGNMPEFKHEDSQFYTQNNLEYIINSNPDADVFLLSTNKSVNKINEIKKEQYLQQGREKGLVANIEGQEYGDGTRFLVTKNNAETGLMNGDILTLTISSVGIYTFVDQYEREFPDVDFKRHGIKLGFAMTIHKAQGSTINNVVTILDNEYMSTRALLYTAITRASKTHRLYEVTPGILSSAIHKTVVYQDYDYHKMLEL